MKEMFDKVRADRDFNLETLSYEELFEGLKFDFAQAIRVYSKQEVDVEDLRLNVDRCSTRSVYAEDGNLYPKIYLDLKCEYSFVITPFEIEMMIVNNKIRTYSNAELREAFYNFMCDKFPNAEYDKKYEKYCLDVQKMQKINEKLLFL